MFFGLWVHTCILLTVAFVVWKYQIERRLQIASTYYGQFLLLFFLCHRIVTVGLIGSYSSYAKQRLVDLHPNVMVQRSPSHFQTGTFYWAHVRLRPSSKHNHAYHTADPTCFYESYASLQHEKLCVIDQTIAFMGGLDLCFGR